MQTALRPCVGKSPIRGIATNWFVTLNAAAPSIARMMGGRPHIVALIHSRSNTRYSGLYQFANATHVVLLFQDDPLFFLLSQNCRDRTIPYCTYMTVSAVWESVGMRNQNRIVPSPDHRF